MVYAVADFPSSPSVRDGPPRPWATSPVAPVLPMGTTCDAGGAACRDGWGMKKSVLLSLLYPCWLTPLLLPLLWLLRVVPDRGARFPEVPS